MKITIFAFKHKIIVAFALKKKDASQYNSFDSSEKR